METRSNVVGIKPELHAALVNRKKTEGVEIQHQVNEALREYFERLETKGLWPAKRSKGAAK